MSVAAGVQCNLVGWNTLLTAFARTKHIDGAYEVWMQMQQSGVVSDRFTVVCNLLSHPKDMANLAHSASDLNR
jgi:pentatricopeptide repeat protein